MNGSRIVAVCIEDFQSLPPAYRPSTAERMITDGSFDPSSDSGKECIAYLKKNVGKLHEIAMRDIKVLYSLCEYHLISARDFDLFMQEAEKSDNIELKSMLLDYQNQLGLNALTNVREKREKVKADYQDALVDRIGTCDPKGGIKGLTFAVTGKLEQWTSRETIREWLELHGANLGSCVSRKSDYLVSNSSTGSTREKNKAMELGVSVIDETAFNGMVCWRYQCGETITVPGWVRRIPADAFTENCKDGWNCTKSVVISEGVTHISDCAFNQCYNLKNVKIPTSVVSIGERAFASCSGLARVTIPGKLKTVGKGAFHNCGHIDFICDDPNTLALLIEKDFEIEDSVLKKYNGPGGNVTIPKDVTEIGGSAFYNCYLTNVIIPESVIRIGDYAFRYCGTLSSVTIPESVTRIGFFSFENCPNLTIHAPAGSYAEQYAKENKIPFVAK